MNHTVLFLCTGNYYRSRFVEHLFNDRARSRSLAWSAISRGIATEIGTNNIGPMSSYALQGLTQAGVKIEAALRFPLQLQEQDLACSDLIIALNDVEHRPLLQTRFPKWVHRVEYWEIADLDQLSAEKAWVRMTASVMQLIQRLEIA